MVTSACVSCGQIVEESRLLLSDKGSICDICNVDAEMPTAGTGLITPTVIVSVVACLLPFIIRVRQSSVSMVDGDTVVGASISYIALVGGATALVVALVLLIQGFNATKQRFARLMIAVVIFLFGALQVVRGFVPIL